MYDVFISYCSKNQKQADRIHKALTDRGYSCWYAPADIHGSQRFTQVIPPAIRNSKAFLLLMSGPSQESKWVHRELGLADKYSKPIFTFFLEEIALNDEYDFVLQYDQHYVATLGFEEQMRRLLIDLPPVLDAGETTEPVSDIKTGPAPKKYVLPLILGVMAVAAFLIAGWFLFFSGPADGEYVIWNPAYSVALSCDTVNDHYRAGETVLCKGDSLTSFSQKCVWELDFDSADTFTMSHNGQLLGVQPGYNGIGLGGDYSAVEWELVDAGDGYYYIRNTESGYFLEWYDAKDNWSTYANISDDNRDLFLLRLDAAE